MSAVRQKALKEEQEEEEQDPRQVRDGNENEDGNENGNEDGNQDGNGNGNEEEEMSVKPLPQPYRLRGKIVKGFGRGSRQLGTPTANLDPEAFKEALPKDAAHGVYAGWASVDGGPVYKAILSIGTNPHFDGVETTVESYLVHQFSSDFYGSQMSLLICAYIRPMLKFSGLEELIAAIKRDIEVGCEALDKNLRLRVLQKDQLFQSEDLRFNSELDSVKRLEVEASRL